LLSSVCDRSLTCARALRVSVLARCMRACSKHGTNLLRTAFLAPVSPMCLCWCLCLCLCLCTHACFHTHAGTSAKGETAGAKRAGEEGSDRELKRVKIEGATSEGADSHVSVKVEGATGGAKDAPAAADAGKEVACLHAASAGAWVGFAEVWWTRLRCRRVACSLHAAVALRVLCMLPSRLCRLLLPADKEHAGGACGVERQMPTEADNARSVTAELMAGLRRKAKPSTIDPVPGAAQAKKEV
jgi:hypothetical protein